LKAVIPTLAIQLPKDIKVERANKIFDLFDLDLRQIRCLPTNSFTKIIKKQKQTFHFISIFIEENGKFYRFYYILGRVFCFGIKEYESDEGGDNTYAVGFSMMDRDRETLKATPTIEQQKMCNRQKEIGQYLQRYVCIEEVKESIEKGDLEFSQFETDPDKKVKFGPLKYQKDKKSKKYNFDTSPILSCKLKQYDVNRGKNKKDPEQKLPKDIQVITRFNVEGEFENLKDEKGNIITYMDEDGVITTESTPVKVDYTQLIETYFHCTPVVHLESIFSGTSCISLQQKIVEADVEVIKKQTRRSLLHTKVTQAKKPVGSSSSGSNRENDAKDDLGM